MNPATGTFITMDEYAGSIFEPVSLHKYLYANANPVMNSDPSGYQTLKGLVTSMVMRGVLGAMIGACYGGMLNALLANLKGADTSQIAVAFLEGFVSGAFTGAFFGALGVLATKYYLARYTLASFEAVFAGMSIGTGINDLSSGYTVAGIIEIGLGVGLVFSSVRNAFVGYKTQTSSTQTPLNNIKIDDFVIKNKHLTSSGSRYNKFNVATEAEAKIIVKDAIKNGSLVSIEFNKLGSQGQMSYNIILETGKVIGTKGETGIKICFDDFGNVWTVYPYKTGGK